MFSRRKKDGNPGCQYVEDEDHENGLTLCGRPVESSTVDTSELGDGSKMELEWKVYCRRHLEDEEARVRALEVKEQERQRVLRTAREMTEDLAGNIDGLIEYGRHGHLFYLNASRAKIRDISAIIEQEHTLYLYECKSWRPAEKSGQDEGERS